VNNGARTAIEPFHFFTIARVTDEVRQEAHTVRELLSGLARCSDKSVCFHMRRPMGGGGMKPGTAPNDFAKWVNGFENCAGLGEQLTALDERYYTSVAEMRNDVIAAITEYISAYPECAESATPTIFYFHDEIEQSVPLDVMARSLEEFRAQIESMSVESFYLHFVASPRRFDIQSNDFSVWLTESLGLKELAAKINEIDLRENTLESARERILRLIDGEIQGH